MSLKPAQRRALEARHELVHHVESLFVRDDRENPKVLDDDGRQALHATVSVAIECDQAFRRIQRSRRPLQRTFDVDYLCDSIHVAIPEFSQIKALGRIVRDVHLEQPRSGRLDLASLLTEHTRMMPSLRSIRADFAGRLTTLLAMNQIELLFFAHMW
jgi:hypothetical protein